MKVILTTSESLLRWWNIKEAKTIPGTWIVGSAAILMFGFVFLFFRLRRATTAPYIRSHSGRVLQPAFFVRSHMGVSRSSPSLPLESEQSIVGTQDFLFCRGIKHYWRYLITTQVFISFYGVVFRLWYCSFLKLSVFRNTCNGTAAIFFPVSWWIVPEYISSYCFNSIFFFLFFWLLL